MQTEVVDDVGEAGDGQAGLRGSAFEPGCCGEAGCGCDEGEEVGELHF